MAADNTENVEAGAENPAKAVKPRKKRRSRKKRPAHPAMADGKGRSLRSYPASSFEDALTLGQEIIKHAPEGKMRRLTFCKVTNRSATSSVTRMLITNSSKYAITKGSYVAEYLEMTSDGLLAVNPQNSKERLQGRCRLAIDGIPPFKALYHEYVGKRIPSHEVMKDFLISIDIPTDNLAECLDLFIVNVTFLGLLQTIGGSETLVPVEHLLDELKSVPVVPQKPGSVDSSGSNVQHNVPTNTSKDADWSKICFYISPIGSEESDQRQHSNLFLNHLVEPALEEFGLKVVRADLIGESGMITAQILEHILNARLVIVDLSFHNPNVFYELAISHACKLPIVQIIRKSDKIPFDVDQIRTIQIDNSGIYTLVPKLSTYRSEIATHVRQALANPDVSNPLTLFCPGFQISLPK